MKKSSPALKLKKECWELIKMAQIQQFVPNRLSLLYKLGMLNGTISGVHKYYTLIPSPKTPQNDCLLIKQLMKPPFS